MRSLFLETQTITYLKNILVNKLEKIIKALPLLLLLIMIK